VLKLLAVGAGGFLGALARYGLSGWAQRLANSSFPAGTLVVNVAGCLAIGVLMALVQERQLFSPYMRLLVATGFLGALTTFSTFGYETVELLRGGESRLAVLSVAGNLLLGVGAVAAGWVLVRSLT